MSSHDRVFKSSSALYSPPNQSPNNPNNPNSQNTPKSEKKSPQIPANPLQMSSNSTQPSASSTPSQLQAIQSALLKKQQENSMMNPILAQLQTIQNIQNQKNKEHESKKSQLENQNSAPKSSPFSSIANLLAAESSKTDEKADNKVSCFKIIFYYSKLSEILPFFIITDNFGEKKRAMVGAYKIIIKS